MKLRIILSIFLTTFILGLWAQDLSVKPDYQKKFRHLTTRDGLSNNKVLDIMQDRYGFIWIATMEGLNRYDAYDFLVFKHSESDSGSLSSNLVTSLTEDIYGNLWVGTEFGLNRYDRKHNKFIHYFEEDGLKNNHIRALMADEKGNLWIETVDGYLHLMHIKNEIFEAYKHRGTSQPYYHYHSIFKQNDTSIWVGGRNQNVQRFNPKTHQFKVFPKTDSYDFGKRVNDVSHYFEDSKGQFWVCGLDGAYQFDPLTGNFKLFLRGSAFYIFEDDQNNLWFGTGNGIYIYDRRKKYLSHITSDVNNINSLSNKNVNKIIQDRSGVIWVATNNGLNIYSPKLHQFTHYYHIPENNQSISGRKVTALEEDENGLWVGTAEEGLNYLNLESGEVKKYDSHTRPVLISNRISDLLLDDDKNLWIAHWSGKGIESLNPKMQKTKKFRIDKNATDFDWYSQILAQKNHDLLLAVWGGDGLYQIDVKNQMLKNLGKDLVVLPNEPEVKVLNCQNDSIWWLGGENGCIRFYLPNQSVFYKAKNLFQNKKPRFKDLQKMKEYNYINADIPNFQSIEQIYFRNDTTYFVSDSILMFFDYQSSTFGSVLEDQNKIESSFTNSYNDLPVVPLSDSIIDFVDSEFGVFCISSKKLYQFDTINRKLSLVDIKIIPDIDFSEMVFNEISFSRNQIVIATNKGIISISIASNYARFIRNRSRQFMGYPVHLLTAISQGNNNDYWLGTTATGIARYFPEENKIVNYISDELDSTAFWGWTVSFIYKDRQGRIWAGGRGLHLYDEESDGFIHYTTQNGLPTNQIFGMTEDASGHFWLTTDKGLSCFHMDEETFVNYDEAAGLPEKEMTDAIIKLKDQRIAAGLSNGFVVFNPDSLIANHYIPPVILTKFQVINGQTYNDLADIDSIVLQPNEKHIAFSFSSLDFNSPQNNQYEYKLNGVDEKWLKADAKSRWINYSNLKPGIYELQLRGSNNNGIWNNNGKSLSIFIKPHFYEQWWFDILMALFVIFVIVMIVIYRVRELNLQSKSAQLEQKFLRSQMNPHFIFNSLGAIQNFIFKNEALEAATYLSDFSNLVRKILNNSRQDLIPLEEEVETLKQYLELQKLRFNDKFDYELKVDEPLRASDYQLPPMLAQPFIENSIEHAFKGMKEKGLIKIFFELKERSIRLICQDNGMGIKAALEDKKENVKKHQSLATKITHDRIKVIRKVYKAKINLNIQDLKEIDSSKKGTQVIIEIPLDLKKR